VVVHTACTRCKIGGSFVDGIAQNFPSFFTGQPLFNEPDRAGRVEPKGGGELVPNFDSRFGGQKQKPLFRKSQKMQLVQKD